MPKIQTNLYSTSIQAVAPATQQFVLGGSIVIPGGSGAVLQLPAPPEGKAIALTIKQTAGSSAAFKAELLNSSLPYPGPYTGSPAIATFALPGTPSVPVELFRVIEGGLSGVAGTATEWRDDYGRPYRNLDKVKAIEANYVYVVILPTGAGGSTSWDVMFTTYRDLG